MARNEEKQLGGLNRIVLHNEKQKQLRKNPPRPKLCHLKTADEVKQWLPSIKRDLEFNLTQSQVICYSDDKISELHKEVSRLEKEYKCFVHKLRRLDPNLKSIPWTNRPYEKNESREVLAIPDCIETPILDMESNFPPEDEELDLKCNEETADAPLAFSDNFKPVKKKRKIRQLSLDETLSESVKRSTDKLLLVFGISSNLQPINETTFSSNPIKKGMTDVAKKDEVSSGKCLLGLDYSSSEDES